MADVVQHQVADQKSLDPVQERLVPDLLDELEDDLALGPEVVRSRPAVAHREDVGRAPGPVMLPV